MTDCPELAPLARIIDFLREIGFDIKTGELSDRTVLPGITVDRGAILIDETTLLYPGDLLHEAGHLAVIPREKRKQAQDNVGKRAAEEMMAIAWSYAALVHIGLDPAVVFHAGGYRGWSSSLIENFTQGRYVGVSMLEWLGLSADKKKAKELGIKPYPAMIKWMLE
ncbi:MAG TPA: hypothetical protein VLM38_05120 [Blastocatellia bacterium]|nr:hypothetical protein [Blastocatellia bacterium]